MLIIIAGVYCDQYGSRGQWVLAAHHHQGQLSLVVQDMHEPRC